jgi:hypothetical protein
VVNFPGIQPIHARAKHGDRLLPFAEIAPRWRAASTPVKVMGHTVMGHTVMGHTDLLKL